MKLKVILFLLFIVTFLSVSAQSNRSSLEQKRKALLSEIKGTARKIDENKKSIKSVSNNLSLITQQIESRKKLIQVLNEEAAALDLEIKFKELEITSLEKDFLKKKEQYILAVQKIHKQKKASNELLFILSADNFAQSFRRMLYLKTYSDWQKEQATEITGQQEKIISEKKILEDAKQEKETLAITKKQEEEQLHQEEVQKKNEINSLQKNSQKLQAELAKKQKQADDLNKEIERIIQSEIKAAQQKTKSQPNVERKAAVTGGYAMTKEEQKLSSNFAANKGKLPLPLKGQYSIVRKFGTQAYEGLRNVKINNNGIDIKTTAGNNAKAVSNGVVSSIVRLKDQPITVMVRHGNYITVYSSLSSVFVKTGDTVKAGQDLGKIYDDPERGTVLHFELWKESTKINPELWINK